LIGVKGKSLRVNKTVSSVIMAPIGQHSEKPDEVRKRIVEICGNRRRIELFAREKVKGWDAWGNEIDSDITLD
jgi:site-specific DNA-methyltransferase (adenine-specific)